MKTNIIKSIFILILTWVALSMTGQDFMTIHFKDGSLRTFHFSNIKSISTSKVDADGMFHSDYQFQHISTLNENYVYDLAIIDSISFTKYHAESARKDLSSAINVALSTLADCESISDVENKLDIIKNADGIEKIWTEGSFLRIKPRNSKPFTIDFGNYGLSNDNDSRFLTRMAESIRMAERPDSDRPNGEKLKMVIANEMDNDMNNSWQRHISEDLNPLKEKLDNVGISVKYVPMPDLEFFRSEMYNYDAILLCTHGGYFSNIKQHVLLSGPVLGEVLITEENEEGIDESAFQDNYDRIFTDDRYKDAVDDMEMYIHKEKRTLNGQERDHWIGYPLIYESFIENRATGSFSNPKSILFMASCLTLNHDNNLAQIFFDKRDLNTYLGYTESTYFCQETGPRFYESYFNNASAWKAYNDLGDVPVRDDGFSHKVSGTCKDEDVIEYNDDGSVKRKYTANLKILSADKEDEDLLHFFLSTPYTIDTKDGSALESYNKEKAVPISATIMALDPDKVTKGFKYGTNKYYLSEDKKADIAMKTIEVGKGNYLIQAKLTDLKPDNTYYYRAYTYDGENYNNGDLCSFTLYHNLQVPVQELELEEGEKVSFTIAAGSGEYTTKSDQENYAKASVNGNEVFIEAISEGDAVITITDMKTEQTAEVAVKVINKPTPDIILSTQEVYMEVGETQQIEVTSGSGSYSVWVYAPDVADVTVYGNIITIKALSAGKTIARVIDDITGKEKPFGIEVKETTSETDSQELMLSKQVNGVDYKIYKKILDPSDYHINPDGWKCYRSELILETTSNGSTKTTVMDDHIYLDDSRGHHGGQTPCMLLDFIENQIIIFCNSKDAGNNYTMEGYAYISPITNLRFSKETVFTKANWGWYPFFSLSGNSVQLNYFSYAGYYAMIAERNGNGSWNNQRVGSIKPDAFEAMSKENGPVTVIENAELPTPDENLPAEAVDLGLPSGTLWASYNVGAKRPEDFGGFYAWGETFEKTDYSQTDYTMYGKYTRSDGLTELEPEDDVATVLWGAPWHMPTKAQMQELINNCTWTWITINGTNGFRVTGSNGNSIFLPAAGTKADGSHNIANQRLTYWSNAVNTSNTNQAGMIWSWENPPAEYDTVSRWFGYSVRAVRDKEEVDERIEDVIPGEYRDIIDDYIPIYDGINPPNVEGVYYIDPEILTASSLSNDQIGKKYNSEYLKLSEQDMTKNTVKMIRVQGGGSEWAKGDGAFISGSGNNFTIFFNSKGKSSGVDYVMAYVISGTKTANGIKNYTSGFILKEKGADPDDKMVKVGTFRFFKDQDGMSENAEWPYGNTYDARKRNATGNRLPNSLDAE